MSLMEQLNADMKEAMRSKDKEKLSVIRMLKASVQKEEIEMKRTLTADEELTILSRELKQRKDSIAEFEKANRQDLAQKTAFEVTIVQHYMPKQLTIEEVKALVLTTVQQVGATQPSDFGKVMQAIMPQVKGKADGNIVNQAVKEALSDQ